MIRDAVGHEFLWPNAYQRRGALLQLAPPLPALAGGTFLLLPWRKGYPVWAGLLGILGLLAAIPWALYVLYVVVKALV
ncbi:hypothetical protein [Corallococcus macrosporus]|uniref:Uncharacterized protein n=1 Tax=Myxococcus fulvus (strain ATCC BAA-855 / HW-1) TaxID=483219 RepID=F8CDP8_MYXFH|nr:hypothetical protein [Corallococcus macrosporus]AEI68538.1 hypothetical protein LILAB_33285 [Corallococcus macrosporus]